MNKILIGFMAAVLAVVTQPYSNAQEYATTPVTISKEKVRVKGTVCYSHIVKDKQTLYSIAKAYNVTIEDIYKFNPAVETEGLKKNSIILIPSHDSPQTRPETGDKKQEDIVVKEEPAQADAQKEEKKKETEPKKEKHKKTKQKVHVRKWYEDLDVIAEKYGVTVEAIIEANDLTGRKLANRQKLIIPEKDDTDTSLNHNADGKASAEDTTHIIEADTTSQVHMPAPELVFIPKETINMTVILPMKASTENISRNNIDFYSGILVAARDIAEGGVDMELNVYDSADPTMPVSKEDLENSDVIIGPVSAGDLSRLLEEVPDTTPVISPLDQRAEHLVYNHSNFIQSPAPHKVQYKDLMNWMQEERMEGDRILVISEKVKDRQNPSDR